MPEKDPLLERQQLHADSLEGDDKADGGLYTMGQTNAQRGILQGKRILVTRTREQAGVLSERLLALGAMPVEFPTIRIVPPHNWASLDWALGRLFPTAMENDDQRDCPYAWLIFTSANGVHICCERLLERGYDLQAMCPVCVAAQERRYLGERAESYARDARKFRDACNLGHPIIGAEEDAHWASVYQAIADELRKITAGAALTGQPATGRGIAP